MVNKTQLRNEMRILQMEYVHATQEEKKELSERIEFLRNIIKKFP